MPPSFPELCGREGGRKEQNRRARAVGLGPVPRLADALFYLYTKFPPTPFSPSPFTMPFTIPYTMSQPSHAIHHPMLCHSPYLTMEFYSIWPFFLPVAVSLMVNAVQCMPLAWHSWWYWWWYRHGMDDGIGYADEKKAKKKREFDPRFTVRPSIHASFLPSFHHVAASSCSMQCMNGMAWHSPWWWWWYHAIRDGIACNDDNDECNGMYGLTFHATASHWITYHGNRHHTLRHHVRHDTIITITIIIMENSMAMASVVAHWPWRCIYRMEERTGGRTVT